MCCKTETTSGVFFLEMGFKMLILVKRTMTEIPSALRQRNLKTYLIFTVRPTVHSSSLFKMERKRFENGSFGKR